MEVITIAAAIGEAFAGNPGAIGLAVAGVALVGAAAVQMTLAIDATMQAAGHEGFLSAADKERMNIAIHVLGAIAIIGSLLGITGSVLVALGSAAKTASALAMKEVTTLAVTKLVAIGMKESATAAGRATAQAVPRYAMYAFKQSMAPMLRYAAQVAFVSAFGQGTNMIVSGAGKLEVAKLQQAASDLQAEADKAEAAAAAIEAMVARLRAIIEQLQSELEKLVEEGQETMNVIMGAIDESQQSMTNVIQSASA
jgi:hypothetical protein